MTTSAGITEAFALNAHLSKINPIPLPGGRYKHFASGFVACLEGTRAATGRDITTGALVRPVESGSWHGNIGYFVLLDQIGSCFSLKSGAPISGNTNAITRALKTFTSLSEIEIKALYALRCSIAHDFSLCNVNAPDKTHQFGLTKNSGVLIILPKTQWDGDYLNRVPDNATIIDLTEFGNLVEGIVSRILTAYKANDLKIILPGGPDELFARYIFTFTV